MRLCIREEIAKNITDIKTSILDELKALLIQLIRSKRKDVEGDRVSIESRGILLILKDQMAETQKDQGSNTHPGPAVSGTKH